MIPQDANKPTKPLMDRPFPFLFSLGGQFANMGELAAATQRLIAKTARAQAHTLVKTSHWKYLPAVGPTVHGARCTVHSIGASIPAPSKVVHGPR